MIVSSLDEPELEFGSGMRQIDIRFGLSDYGPFDGALEAKPNGIRLGIVGTSETVDGTAAWVERCQNEISAKQSRQPTLFPAFPGLKVADIFRCEITAPMDMQRLLRKRDVDLALAKADPEDIIRELVSLFAEEIRELANANTRPNVILVALPLNIIERVFNTLQEADDDEEDQASPNANFRGMLKSATMTDRIPIQILWPTTYDPSIAIFRKVKKSSPRRVQDDATRAWNFFTAIYYKAGGLPWRIVRDSRKLRTSFVGISFYKSADGQHVHTSTAQMFDERGEGLILRGGRAEESRDDRQPHLNEEDAYVLLSQSLTVFRNQHGHFPARVVLHKTSRFDDAEMSGFEKALDEREIDYADFIRLSKSMMRLYRHGGYPPLRGTFLKIDPTQALLYTKGSVEFFKTYPGMYVPRPLLINCQKLGQPLSHIAAEILALTKMNWNNTQFDGGFPVTIEAARHVGEILKYVPEGQEIAPRYSFYM